MKVRAPLRQVWWAFSDFIFAAYVAQSSLPFCCHLPVIEEREIKREKAFRKERPFLVRKGEKRK